MVRSAAVTAASVLLWWGLLFLLYVILISGVPPLELMVGAAFALLGAIAAEALRRAEHPRVRLGARLVAAAAAFPLTLLRETGQLAALTFRTLRGARESGTVVTIRLPGGTDAGPAAGLLSASPGACVIDITGPSDSPEKSEQTPGAGHDLTAHLLADRPSRVEQALGGRRLT
jgi:hypothetical protein